MTMLANTAIAVEHRHRRSPDVDAPAILHDEDADLLVSRERAALYVKCLCECLHARACTGLSRNGGGGASLFYAERGARSIYAHHMALLVSADGIRCRTAATSCAKGTAPMLGR